MIESKELHKMEETEEKETKETETIEKKTETVNNKNSGHFRNMSTDHKAQNESYANRSVNILFLLYFVFCSLNVSCGIGLLVCCICTRNLHENMCVYVRACVCVHACVCMRTYVGVAVT